MDRRLLFGELDASFDAMIHAISILVESRRLLYISCRKEGD